jgi:hypothetical protein
MNKLAKHIPQSIAPSPIKPVKIKLYTIDQITHPKKKLFIETYYATNGNVTATTKAVKVHRRSFYNWLDTDPCFKALIDEQRAQLLDEIDEVCRNTAKTKQGITDRIFWLKTHHPEYQQRDTMAFKDSQGNQFVLTRGH